ncbi:MAG: hypothetical protein ACYTKD_29640 [Planctomycetota bacterium]
MKEIPETWNKGNLSKIRSMTNARKVKLRTRLRDPDFRTHWKDAMRKLHMSTFAQEGRWATFNWFVKNDDNWRKAWEGAYDDRDGVDIAAL